MSDVTVLQRVDGEGGGIYGMEKVSKKRKPLSEREHNRSEDSSTQPK